MTVTEPEPTPDIAPADANTRPEGENALAWPSANDIPDFEEDPAGDPPAEDPPADPPAEDPPADPPVEETPPAGDGFEALPESWQAKVTELREESKNYRLRAKEFHEAFEGYDEETRDKFLDMARGLADESRHVEVAKEFVAVGKRVLEAYGEDITDLTAPDPNRPLTVRELEAREAKQAEERAAADAVAAIAKEVEELGYVQGSADHYTLLRLANDSETGDLKEAHEKLQAHTVEKAKALLASDAGADLRKQVIEDFIKAVKEKQATHLPTTPATGVAPADPGDEPVTSFDGTRARMEQFLSDFQG